MQTAGHVLLCVTFASGCGGAARVSESGALSATTAGPVTTIQLGPVHLDVPAGSRSDGGRPPKQLRVFESPSSTFDVAKAAAARMDAKNLEGERTSDGHWISFERPGSVGPTFGVQVARRIGAHVYVCEGLFDRADDARVALTICRTMRQ